VASDEQLVQRLATGDDHALRRLLERYERPLSAFIWRNTGGQEVEDIYQETWLRVVRNARRFDAKKRFSTWLFQIAVNLCRDWHRHARVASKAVSIPTQPSESGRVETAIDAERMLAALSPEQREVLSLRYFEDMSQAEVALTLDIPEGTVKSRLHHAIARLAKLFGGKSK
jgi:RNA polymerase sigma-70 factor (ECF subfamily)